MGFNRRRMESERAAVAEKEAAARRALAPQIASDALRIVAAWNKRQAAYAPLLFSPTIGAAITARHWFLWVRWRLGPKNRPGPKNGGRQKLPALAD
jgi:hypothetical protein